VSDEQLWGQLKQGEKDALSELARRFYRPLLHYGTRFTTDHDLIKDTIQDVLLTLWQGRDRLGEAPASSARFVKFYLFKTLRHRLFKEFKRRELFQSDHEEDELPEEEADFAFIQQQQEVSDLAQLQRLLDQLTPRQREILYLRYYEDLSLDEIAQLTGINRQSVANTLHRTLVKLRGDWIAGWFVAYAGSQQLFNYPTPTL
jgi:RNA polymerase sigma factor (sigma-70 family)